MKKTPPKPKGRPRAFDPDSALDRAMHVFWRKGYVGTSLSDLTEAMGVNRPSLYAAFGNKEDLYRKVLQRYGEGPACHMSKALGEPTARQVVERMLYGSAELATDKCNPSGCLWVHGALSCDPDDRLRKEMLAHHATAEAELRKRFKRAMAEGDLPRDTDVAALTRWVSAVNFGIAVQAATGATRAELRKVIEMAMRAWPS